MHFNMNESNIVIDNTDQIVHYMELKLTASKSGKMKKNRDLEAGWEYLVWFLCTRSVTSVAAEEELTLPADARACFLGKRGSGIALTKAKAGGQRTKPRTRKARRPKPPRSE